MNVLKFTLSGNTAFFKKPDVNTYLYFTYGHIHKVALLGILGAIMGYGGYNQQIQDDTAVYPEFYEKLKNIKVGIVPKNHKGYITKKVQIFNNTVGYANKDGNLIVKEQWLENPEWDIYVLIQGDLESQLAKRMLDFKFQYIPYLGKNDHIANIIETQIIYDVEKINDVNRLDSLFVKDYFELYQIEQDIFEADPEEKYEPVYKYEEMLPIILEETTNKYEFQSFIYTNSNLKIINSPTVYRCNEKLVFFF
ncbi:type I-B CRISPR-associated protein Cas5b [Alkaliphilus sp. MSJ-5]|uniref:Type I-B CRISPR-associated protein Cas5b n=1 Tax=Alkaliphilus flagellatus TaxID=2841507 RepID=A0ABS6G427_9FIRM|nr:type I-B CRISPR-associated protein Cas5b [Alkaliphilus flagellatus]MBU5677232.1 type I-B CRISPR-associated protein Cas5b [Alkaliphilus flagellatus]